MSKNIWILLWQKCHEIVFDFWRENSNVFFFHDAFLGIFTYCVALSQMRRSACKNTENLSCHSSRLTLASKWSVTSVVTPFRDLILKQMGKLSVKKTTKKWVIYFLV